MIFKIAGGIAFILLGIETLYPLPPVLTAIFCIIAGIALLAGI